MYYFLNIIGRIFNALIIRPTNILYFMMFCSTLQVNLYDARHRRSKQLSGGMRRRLSVAMSCIGNPDILILDEPTTGLDPASRRQVWEVIERVKDGRSVILTTHAMEEADHLCTRIG